MFRPHPSVLKIKQRRKEGLGEGVSDESKHFYFFLEEIVFCPIGSNAII
ncbi:MAG: hypothetical protein JWM20_181 [Patescibacteria group bacterium]|nr:hypothetical protein [Patescibacteria group bacterium]